MIRDHWGCEMFVLLLEIYDMVRLGLFLVNILCWFLNFGIKPFDPVMWCTHCTSFEMYFEGNNRQFPKLTRNIKVFHCKYC